MSPFLQFRPSRASRLCCFFAAAAARALSALCFLALGGCGELGCPPPLSNVDGTCQEAQRVTEAEPGGKPQPKPAGELCDGVDNDGDLEVDEDWPELGEPCGEGDVGECASGTYVCAADGRGVLCEGALGSSAEVCDGRDNDCDGLIDEQVLSAKTELFGDHATVAAVEGGFLVGRLTAGRVRVETFDTQGVRTGRYDDIASPSEATAFVDSSSSGARVLVGLGKSSFYVIEAHVDSDLVPIILGTEELHPDWDQASSTDGFPAWGVNAPPYHPRVTASPPRFVGYLDPAAFALSSFSSDGLAGLAQAPTLAPEVPLLTVFDAAGPFLVWEQGDNLRAGWLRNDGALALGIDVARGYAPAIRIGRGEPGLVYLQDGALRVSELGALTLQCRSGGFCNEAVDTDALRGEPSAPTGLAFDQGRDAWFVAAGTQVAIVGRGAEGAVVQQAEVRDMLGGAPARVEVAVSGGAAAVLQATLDGASALTFFGCF